MEFQRCNLEKIFKTAIWLCDSKNAIKKVRFEIYN